MIVGYDAKRLFHNTTGLGNYSRSLVEALSLYYPDHTYVLFNPKRQTTNRFVPKPNTVEVRPEGFWDKRFPSFWRSRGVLKSISERNIDIYHGLSGELPNGIALQNVKTVVTIHDLIFLRYPELYAFVDVRIYKHKFKYAAAKADLVVAISEQTKQDVINFLKIPEEKIRVVYQSCDETFKKTYKAEEKKAVLEKYGISAPYVLSVGTIEERKNLLTLVKSIKDIDVNLVAVGSGKHYKDSVKNYVSENGMAHRVYFLEGLSLKEIAILYQEAHVFVFPSIFEGFGIPIIEAMYSKTPVITSKGSCFPEAGGPHSTYIDPHDHEALSTEIKVLLLDHNKRQKQVEQSYAFVQKFSDEQMASQIMTIYKELLEIRKR